MPAESAVIMPDDEPMLSCIAGGKLHVPPADASVSVELTPMHTLILPKIVPGSGFTVNALVVMQPVGSV